MCNVIGISTNQKLISWCNGAACDVSDFSTYWIKQSTTRPTRFRIPRHVDGVTQLRHSHDYYSQIQCQTGVLDIKYYDFFVYTLFGNYLEQILSYICSSVPVDNANLSHDTESHAIYDADLPDTCDESNYCMADDFHTRSLFGDRSILSLFLLQKWKDVQAFQHLLSMRYC